MKGKFFIKVYNKRVSFEIEVKRSVTIIRGNSATGKSTFINMLDAGLTKNESGVKLQSDFDINRIRVISDERMLDDLLRLNDRDMLFVADEGINLAKHKMFIKYLQESGSYLIYVTRKNQTGFLQFAVSEIYIFKNEKRENYTAVKMYQKYFDDHERVLPDIIITEDTNSGHDIIEHIVNIPVISSGGKDNVANTIVSAMDKGMGQVYVSVDCAAFGNCMEKVTKLGAHVNLSESMEYLMLNSYVFRRFITDELTDTYNYAESSVYYTWEQYYTGLLQKLCGNFTDCSYGKELWDHLNDTFKTDRFLKDISNQLDDLDSSVKKYQ